MYRSGDLARIDEQGQIQCLGRSDDQVKVRGFRVELGEIEAALYRQPGVGAAAVVLRDLAGIEQLVAFLAPEGEARPDPHALRAGLAQELPAYMIPARFELVAEVPRLTSGKIDRKALKARELATAAEPSGEDDLPATAGEQALFEALRPLFPGQPLRLASDFFRDLGGHSLLAARLVSSLRKHPHFSALTMHELYQHSTLAALAGRLDALAVEAAVAGAGAAREAVPERAPEWRRWACGLAQLAALPILIGVRMLIWLTPFFTYHYFTGDEGDSVWLAVTLSISSYLACNLLSFGVAVAGKWGILGRLKAVRYPLYGWMFYRWWLVDRIMDIPPAHLLAGSPLQAWYLRALGARIGQDTAISRISVRAPDLLSVGDGASIGAAVNLENFEVRGGVWEVSPIRVGANAYIGSYAVLQGDVEMGDEARLDGLSSLARGARIPAGQIWSGAPARHDPQARAPELPPRPERHGSWRRLDMLAYALGGAAIAGLFFMPVFPSFVLIDWIDARWLDLMGARVLALCLPLLPVAGAAGQRAAADADHPGVGPAALGAAAAPERRTLAGLWPDLSAALADQPDPGIQPERAARAVRLDLRRHLVPPAGRQGRPWHRDLDRHGHRAGHADAGPRQLHRRRRDAGRRGSRPGLDDHAPDGDRQPQLRRQRRLRAGRLRAARRRADRRAEPRPSQCPHGQRPDLAGQSAAGPACARADRRLSRAPDLPPQPGPQAGARRGRGHAHDPAAGGGHRRGLSDGDESDPDGGQARLRRRFRRADAGWRAVRHRRLPVPGAAQMDADRTATGSAPSRCGRPSSGRARP
ncbi:phosphopantetheine-binding protein [Achromobacter xylosoxidans]